MLEATEAMQVLPKSAIMDWMMCVFDVFILTFLAQRSGCRLAGGSYGRWFECF